MRGQEGQRPREVSRGWAERELQQARGPQREYQASVTSRTMVLDSFDQV